MGARRLAAEARKAPPVRAGCLYTHSHEIDRLRPHLDPGRAGVRRAAIPDAVGGADAPRPRRPPYPALPSETPATFAPATDGFDYVRRDVMIPMRDGVKLHTVILVPKGARARRFC